MVIIASFSFNTAENPPIGTGAHLFKKYFFYLADSASPGDSVTMWELRPGPSEVEAVTQKE